MMQPVASTSPSGGIPAGLRKRRVGADMEPDDWRGLVGGLLKFLAEESEEPEHAEDAETSHDPANGRFTSGSGSSSGGGGNGWTPHEEEDYAGRREGKGSGGSGWSAKELEDYGDSALDAAPHAAGIMFVTPEGEALFLKRASNGDHPGEYCFPGGGLEEGEDAETAARRETEEETGHRHAGGVKQIGRGNTGGVDYATFGAVVPGKFDPKLNAEHVGHVWAPLNAPPEPLHPGVAATLAGDAMIPQVFQHSEAAARDASGKEAEHTATIKWNGDFNMAGLLKHLRRLGQVGASREVVAVDEDDKPVKFGWDGDGADRIVSAEIDGAALANDASLGADSAHGWGDLENLIKVFEHHLERNLADLAATDAKVKIALDRGSVREIDKDGRMRVEVSNISKSNVCPYVGEEIPGWEELGLDPNKVYNLLRDPDELKKAASTFNGIQLLSRHVPVSIDDHRAWDIVGTTGSEAAFDEPFLKNSLFIWTREGINLIKDNEQKELSCGYHYTPDMTPGKYKGESYDGVMRDIVGNHVALVKDGRAGSDVVVGDSADSVLWAVVERAVLELRQ
jgi:8-oxo-dGTP pyrophosphatase MutT (NUDIX family)